MASSRILRFPRGDDESGCVIVQVTSAGRKPLDLNLAATEGCAPYVCKLKHDRVTSLRAPACPVSEKEWEDILEAVLQDGLVGDVQPTAIVDPESTISLTIRRQVQGITQRLGAITLKCNQDEQLDLFQWCGWSLKALAKSKQETALSSRGAQELEGAVMSLQAELDDLIKAKAEDESALLQKFCLLLNEKKAKIREQKQIIDNYASTAGTVLSSSQPPAQRGASQAAREPAASRSSKRKVGSIRFEAEEDEVGEDIVKDAFVKGEEEDTDPGESSEVDTVSTAAADEDDDDDETYNSRRDGEDTTSSKRPGSPPPKELSKEAKASPPPRRHLPFEKNGRGKASLPAPAEDTDSDDEL
ncbi:hypothetical protein RJ55_00128 [Drechmeria coniospora]|nr:hypothetical protein RJ55_00128 [Drechmeria coniospora]